MGSDSFATDQWRHIDNAKNPADICARAQQAWNILSPVILSGSRPVPQAREQDNEEEPAPEEEGFARWLQATDKGDSEEELDCAEAKIFSIL